MQGNRWSRTDLVDHLELAPDIARSWTFYWPGRIVLEPFTDGVTWMPRDERMPVPVGTALVAPPHAGHVRVHAAEDARFRVLFEHPVVEQIPVHGSVSLPQLWAVPDGIVGVDALYASAVRHLDENVPVSLRVSPCIARTQRSLSETLAMTLDLDALAALAGGVHRSHLCRYFQKATGLPPYRFRCLLRTAKARQLLASGLECTAVAHEVGFCDQSHFTRTFKDLTGTTPRSYARACEAHPSTPRRLAA